MSGKQNNFPNGFEQLQFKAMNLSNVPQLPHHHQPHHAHDKKLNRITTLGTIKIRPISAADAIQNIREVVEHLQDLSIKINDCYGKQAIFSLLSAFICVTVQLYYMLNHIKSGFSQSRSEIYALAACSMLFLHGVEFWSLFTSGENVRGEWKKVINYLYFMKSKSNEEEFRSKADDLISFMTANPLEFNAYGLFPIDLSVISGIASSITTYLIVLIQFKISEDQANGDDSDINDPINSNKMQFSAS
ncbi:conserved hypothetical protein [Culex quinquefasciatus]|uniref:Gustatory receptor n=1 Tax=Culex quinquefasciatus TaxID=7176 RepID=B0XER9_CULQU|nr:conserved hypothetical protein [Culex quinquefasciatus]|eukprot:XP_001868141.1 conserved hypothetical protein [Culex quinquefasciatus]